MANESPHSVATLKELMDERDRRYEQRFRESEKALDLANEHGEKWRTAANEWRQAMTDREREFLPRSIGYIVAAFSVVGLIVSLVDKFK